MKHNRDMDCPACAEKLSTAHHELREWYVSAVKPNFPETHVSWSFRNKEEQEKVFAEGKSYFHFPMSAHNKSDDQGNPCSLALDLFQQDAQGIGHWPPKLFLDISNMCILNKLPIRWGGVWKHLGDADHFELVLEG